MKSDDIKKMVEDIQYIENTINDLICNFKTLKQKPKGTVQIYLDNKFMFRTTPEKITSNFEYEILAKYKLYLDKIEEIKKDYFVVEDIFADILNITNKQVG